MNLPMLIERVPCGLLDIPSYQDRPGILRYEAGLLLDRHLRRLAGVSGAMDRGLARRLHRMRAERLYSRLGYARFVDYARERLEIGIRTAQEFAQLGAGLERLPLLDRALDEGRIRWSAALQVARVAKTEDEAAWVEAAKTLTVRELRARAAGALGEEPRKPGKQGSDFPDEDDDDPPRRLRLEAPRSRARLWEAALELCDLMAGAELSPAEAPEYLLADFLSGPLPEVDLLDEISPRGAPLKWRLSAEPGFGGPYHRLVAALSPDLRPARPCFTMSPDVRACLLLVRAPIETDPFTLDGSMRTILAAKRALDLDLARLLRNFQTLGLARHLGYSGFGEYVEERLGMSARRAGSLVFLDKRLALLPEIAEAVREGAIGTMAAVAISRVASPGESSLAWVERARGRSVLRLREEVSWTERQGRLGTIPVPWMPPPPGRLPSPLEDLGSEILARRQMSAREARGEGEEKAPASWFEPDSMRLLRETLEALSPDPNQEWRVPVEFLLRESALGMWDEARARITASTGAIVVPDHEVLYRVALEFLATHLPAWLDEVERGDPIAVRERFRCAIPGCSAREGAAHHIRFRSQGGSDEPSNLVFLCYHHHLGGVHKGYVRVSGRAPGELRIELGVRPDGTALETFERGEKTRVSSSRSCSGSPRSDPGRRSFPSSPPRTASRWSCPPPRPSEA